MNMLQIEKVLKRDVCTKKYFIGVFPSDDLPKNSERFPFMMVVNTDPHNQPGTHWLAIYSKTPRSIEFFDSYGNSPDFFNQNIRSYVQKYDFVTFNDTPLQSSSTAVCGQYCIYYLYYKARNHSLKSIISSFTPKYVLNDMRVYNFVKKLSKINVQFFQ